MLNSLTEATNAALAADVTQSRWGTIAEAAAFSPIHDRVVPEGVPENPSEELTKIIRRISSKAPSIVEKFKSSSVLTTKIAHTFVTQIIQCNFM